AEMQRIIREVDPPPPSTRLSRSNGTLAGIAAHRGTESRRLGMIVRGELDWIAMKAIDKSRGRRYETAHDLAADVERHLAGDAILAAPPSTAYRLRKVIGRHRVGVTAASMVALALVVGMGAAMWQARIASRERDAARKSAADAQAARNEADAHRKEMEQVAQFQEDQLSGLNAELMG